MKEVVKGLTYWWKRAISAEDKLDKAVKALEFYALEENYEIVHDRDGAFEDEGTIAKQTLKEVRE
jgi:hypothetical protein